MFMLADGGRKLETLERSYKDLELNRNLNQPPAAC